MNTSERLTQLGLCEIPQTRYMDGFDKTIVFAFSEKIAENMRIRFNTLEIPEIAILRGGIIENRGTQFTRKTTKYPIPYSLGYFDTQREAFSCVKQEIDGIVQKVKGVIGEKHCYLFSLGKVFTAAKYFDAWKKLQENPNYINPYNL